MSEKSQRPRLRPLPGLGGKPKLLTYRSEWGVCQLHMVSSGQYQRIYGPPCQSGPKAEAAWNRMVSRIIRECGLAGKP